MTNYSTNAIVGCITNYNFEQIAPWVNSLDRSGFVGTKYMFVYNIQNDVIQELEKRNYVVVKRSLNFSDNIVVSRFFDVWEYFNTNFDRRHSNLLMTDVKDVVFQTNPMIDIIGEPCLITSSEGIKYKDEIWGRSNLYQVGGNTVYQYMKDEIVRNAGVIAGSMEQMLNMMLAISMMCKGLPSHIPGGGGPDQAMLNIYLRGILHEELQQNHDNWASQLGVTGPQKREELGDLVHIPVPYLKDGLVYNAETDTPYAIVHQYDRVPEWRDIIKEKYK